MNKENIVKIYFLETRPHFIILSVILIFLSTSMSLYSGHFNPFYTVLSLIGLVLLHTSTNVLNDYYDYKSGIDLATNPTTFSGGSGIILSGKLTPQKTFWFGIISFICAIPIGIFFVFIKGWEILPIFIIGSIFVLFYTSHIAKIGMGLSEISAGLGLGTLPVLGVYIILNSGFSSNAMYASIPSGVLVFNLLFLNEFPDTEADRIGGRKTIPIIIGKDKSAILYLILTSLVYVWIILGTVIKIMPLFTLIALFTIPFAITAIKGAFSHKNRVKLLKAQSSNVIVILLTQFLIGAGYILAIYI